MWHGRLVPLPRSLSQCQGTLPSTYTLSSAGRAPVSAELRDTAGHVPLQKPLPRDIQLLAQHRARLCLETLQTAQAPNMRAAFALRKGSHLRRNFGIVVPQRCTSCRRLLPQCH